MNTDPVNHSKKNLPGIRRIRLKRYRSLLWCDVPLENPTFLVGKNGAGKSNFFKALEFLSDCVNLPLSSVFQKQGGLETVRYRSGGRSRPGNFGMRVDFATPNGQAGMYAFEVKALSGYEFEVVREQCALGENSFDRSGTGEVRITVTGAAPQVSRDALCLPLLGGLEAFRPVVELLKGIQVFSLDPHVMQDLQDPDSGMRLRSDGGNLASVLSTFPNEMLERLTELLAELVPGVSSVKPLKHGKKVTLKFQQSWKEEGLPPQSAEHEAFAMSEGTLRLLGILVAFLQPNPPTLLALEEPESTIHPEALATLLELIRGFANQLQVVVNTHSPELLDCEWLGPQHLRVVTWHNGKTRIDPLDEATAESLRQHLLGAGELMRREGLQPGNIFADIRPDQMDLFGSPHD